MCNYEEESSDLSPSEDEMRANPEKYIEIELDGMHNPDLIDRFKKLVVDFAREKNIPIWKLNDTYEIACIMEYDTSTETKNPILVVTELKEEQLSDPETFIIREKE